MGNSTALLKAGTAMTKKLSNDLVVAQYHVDTTVTPLVSGTDYSLFTLPKGAIVVAAGITVETGEGAAETVDLGVYGTPAQFLDDKSLETAAVSHLSANTAAYFATADKYVVLLANAAITAAKFTVFCVYGIIESVA